MVYERTEYPTWSWSSSRKSTFTDCLRKYYYNYYLSHNGWETNASEDSKQAYRLKKLTGLHLLLGSAVHKAAEYTCKFIFEEKRLPEEKTVVDMVRDVLNKAWTDSKNVTTWLKQPGKFDMLHEFYYNGSASKDVVDKIKNKLKLAVPNILKSESVKEILEQDCKIRLVEDMDTFDVYDTPVYAIPDLAYERPDGTWVVVDWKTGKEHDSHPAQINVYCMYINEKFSVPTEKMMGRVEYLLSGNYVDVDITDESFEECRKEIRESIDSMKEALLDPEKNIPQEKEFYSLAQKRVLCPWCNFYELCTDELKS
jgi:CRISPR/Cas system-associated exonuclease Cas4 (RecB family)